MRLHIFTLCYWGVFHLFGTGVEGLPAGLLYDFNVPEVRYLPRGDDVSSEEIQLEAPVIFFGTAYETIYVNSNGFLSFQTEIPQFINIEFPLDYPIIAPFYSNVDTRKAGSISYYQTSSPGLLQRATENVQDSFSNMADYQATNLFVATWHGVGYFNQKEDKINTYQVVISTNGVATFVELLYPENGIQWIQGTGDESSGLPDARGQAGIISPNGEMFTLPGSGSEQVRNLEKWSNMNLNGQFIFKVDGPRIKEPDLNNDNIKQSDKAISCSQATTACHIQAKCIDYQLGFCCECKPKFYGNGKFCVKKDVPLRVNGKINGKINGERLDNLDLQSYIVMSDGRAYTAISKIPESIGFDIQSLQVLGGVIGYLFAKPIRSSALNGYQLTGGVFNHTTTIRFLNTSQSVLIKQKYIGLDVFDQLRLEADIQGNIPTLPTDSKVNIDEYQEEYTMTSPGVIQMTSSRSFKYNSAGGAEETVHYNVEQTYVFDYCPFENRSVGETWKLRVGKNFISYESKEQIIRFGLSNKITPLGDSDPCDEGRTKCGPNSACVVENDSYNCVCNPGYQQFFTGNETVCGDLNECQTGQHDCDYNAQCINMIGTYTCQCNPGFEGNGHLCENAHSCQNIRCNENAACEEINSVASCKCLPGFTGNGQTCTPIVDHSCHVSNNCSPYGICTISPETNEYFCTCLPGYEGDGYRCEQRVTTTTEGTGVTDQVGPNVIQRCLMGVCWCPSDYKIQRGTKYCILLDEGETTNVPTTDIPNVNGSCNVVNNCHRYARCLYTPTTDSYDCTCNDGFEGDGYTCQEERTSCTEVDNCDAHATCTYDELLGKSKCVCNEGYDGDGYTCKIAVVAICISNEDCAKTEDCLYSSFTQRYECMCKDGHSRDSQNQCIPSTGICGGGTCVENADCVFDDEYQTHYCTCKAGYIGDGITECVPKPIGCDVLNNCGLNAKCQYDTETTTYLCKCLEGYQGDGYKVCYTEKDCNVDPTMCDPRATCVANAHNRKYVCQCGVGYIGNGTVCKVPAKLEGNFLLLNLGMVTLRLPMEKQSNQYSGKPVQIKVDQTAVGLDIDCVEGRMFWSDITGRAIRSSTLNGSDKMDFIKENIGSPEGLAVDWVSRNIYWTDSTRDTVEVANLDTKLRKTLFSTDLVNPRGIAVHPQRGKIFWTDWNRQNPKIEWANADGTGRQIFLQGDAKSLPNSLAIDFDEEKLCYADAGTKKVECIQIDSRARQTIATNCTYPFGIAVTDTHYYWSDWITKKVERVEKYSLKRLEPLPVPLGGFGNKLFDLVAVPNRCPQLTNVCQYHKCQEGHICLPNGSGSRTCACANKSDAPDEKSSCD